MSFVTSLQCEEHPGGKWRLTAALIYERQVPVSEMPFELMLHCERSPWVAYLYGTLGLDPIGYRIAIPKGFVTDLASIPRLLRGLIDVNGKHRKAAVLHDFLYAQAPALSRALCDAEFGHAMECCEVRWTQRKAMYLGVRAGGWVAYGKHQKRNEA